MIFDIFMSIRLFNLVLHWAYSVKLCTFIFIYVLNIDCIYMNSLHFAWSQEQVRCDVYICFLIYLSFVCFHLGNSPASEFYMPTFRNTVCCIFIGR
jgi:hypothetical protein